MRWVLDGAVLPSGSAHTFALCIAKEGSAPQVMMKALIRPLITVTAKHRPEPCQQPQSYTAFQYLSQKTLCQPANCVSAAGVSLTVEGLILLCHCILDQLHSSSVQVTLLLCPLQRLRNAGAQHNLATITVTQQYSNSATPVQQQ